MDSAIELEGVDDDGSAVDISLVVKLLNELAVVCRFASVDSGVTIKVLTVS